jgi:hypothetical protein
VGVGLQLVERCARTATLDGISHAADLRQNRINFNAGAFAPNRLTCLRIGDHGARVLGA